MLDDMLKYWKMTLSSITPLELQQKVRECLHHARTRTSVSDAVFAVASEFRIVCVRAMTSTCKMASLSL